MVENQEISARQILDVTVEPGGQFWLATSEGMFRYAPLPWRKDQALAKLDLPVHSLATDAQGQLWFLAGNSLHSLAEERPAEFPLNPDKLPALQSSRALFAFRDGSLLLN